jgi:hypothetical protein
LLTSSMRWSYSTGAQRWVEHQRTPRQDRFIGSK